MTSLTLTDFNFKYPEELIGIKPQDPMRVLLNDGQKNTEINKQKLIELFKPGDVLVVNDTKVIPKRVFSEDGLEVLFLDLASDSTDIWSALFPAKKLKEGAEIKFAEGLIATLVEKGFPIKIKLNKKITEEYFNNYGHPALPPYIQKARGQRESVKDDLAWYQTEWAKYSGSSAAPTASLHFSNNDLKELVKKGVKIEYVTLHVGLGTFMPLRNELLTDNTLHSEFVFISDETISVVKSAKDNNSGRVWGLGTTVTRSLESWAAGKLSNCEGGVSGNTDLFIYPGYKFKVIDCLLTNFHQPKSSLLALVSAFAGYQNVMSSYDWAIKNKFKLFSYGDLSVWTK